MSYTCCWLYSQDSRFGPLRSVLAAVPSSGAARYEMVGSLLRNTINSSGFRGGSVTGLRSKYDVVWQLLASGRSSGATAQPKYDPVMLLRRLLQFISTVIGPRRRCAPPGSMV